jgi:hypothetical protein
LVVLAISVGVAFSGAFALVDRGLWGVHQLRDTPLYAAYANATRAGDIPYLNFRLEYPPGAVPVFLAPELAAPGRVARYMKAFEVLMGVCGAALAALVTLALARLGAGRLRTWPALGLVAVSPLLLGPVMLSRFDLVPAMVTIAAVIATLQGRDRLAAFLFAIGGAIKLYPVVCLPVQLAWVARRKGKREAVTCAAVATGTFVGVFAPFAVLAPSGLAHFLTSQLGRPLQIESVAASLLVAAHHLGGLRLVLREDHGSRNIEGTLATRAGDLSTVCQVAVLVVVWLLFARGAPTAERLVAALAAAVASFVALGKVFSPQYMIWLIPLVPLVAGLAGLVASFLTALSLALTQLWFPERYGQYANHLGLFESVLVLLRDLTMLVVVAVLVAALVERRASGAVVRAGPTLSP